MIEILSRVHAKGKKRLNDFKLGTFVAGRVQSDGAARMAAVRGLKKINRLYLHEK